MATLQSQGKKMLDLAFPQLQSPATAGAAMERLYDGLFHLRRCLSLRDWLEFCEQTCQRHPLRDLLAQDPVTRRARQRPHSSLGDAVLLDLIYGVGDVRQRIRGASEVGQEIARAGLLSSMAHSIRWRRALLAQGLDSLGETHPMPQVLALNCGYLREAQSSRAVRQLRIHRLVAVDESEENLAVVAREQSFSGVETLRASFAEVMAQGADVGEFHLIYCAGLYDYLPDGVARELTTALYDLLLPGGRLLVANFAEGLREAGYMESFMDWRLNYREPARFTALASALESRFTAHTTTFFDPFGNVIYLDARRN